MDAIQTQIQTELPFCRLCFSQACDLYELFPGAGNDNESLLLKILELVNVAVGIALGIKVLYLCEFLIRASCLVCVRSYFQINFDEDLNSYICGKCVTTVEDFFDYKEKVKENDLLLREKRKTVDHATAIYNVVSMQPDATNSSASNGATGAGGGSDLGAGGIDESHVGLDQRISIEGGPPLNGNIIEFKKQLFTASPSQLGIWLCVASGSDIQCPAAIEVDDNIQVVAEIGQHNHGLPVSVPENPPETTPTKQQQQQQQQQQHQQPQSHHHTHHGQQTQEQQHHHQHEEDTIVVTSDGTPAILTTPVTPVVANSSSRGTGAAGAASKASSTSSSSSKKKKARDQPSKRKVSNDILVGDGWLTDVTTFKRNHYQLVTKDGYQTFLIYNGYRFRTQQKIRNGIAAWKCAWNGRKGCQAILHITEDYQKVREVGSPHNHEPSLRDRIISNKPTNGNTSDQSLMMQSDGEELGEMHKITATTSVGSTSGGGTGAGTITGETITLGGGATVVAITTTGTNASVNSSTSTASAATLDLTSEMDFVQQSSNSGSELITTTTTTSTPGGSSSSSADPQAAQHHQQHHHHHHHHHLHHAHEVGVVDEVVGKDDTTMSMDIEEIIRPHVVLHPTSE
uniref:ZAD domain-containing protein n=1 Tax=Anopheles christyi TaxID=43041 RepID=A0A182JS54_9DIPT